MDFGRSISVPELAAIQSLLRESGDQHLFFPFMPSTLSSRIKQASSTNKDVAELTEKLSTSLKLDDNDEDQKTVTVPEAAGTPADEDEDDWEKLADKELEAPAEAPKKTAPAPLTPAILELYDFDIRIPMHQLVKDFTRIVDPTASMLFRPKMVGQSLMMTFNNPKHGMSHPIPYSPGSYNCIIQLFLYHATRSNW